MDSSKLTQVPFSMIKPMLTRKGLKALKEPMLIVDSLNQPAFVLFPYDKYMRFQEMVMIATKEVNNGFGS